MTSYCATDMIDMNNKTERSGNESKPFLGHGGRSSLPKKKREYIMHKSHIAGNIELLFAVSWQFWTPLSLLAFRNGAEWLGKHGLHSVLVARTSKQPRRYYLVCSSPFPPTLQARTRMLCATCSDERRLKNAFSFVFVALSRRLLLRRPREELVNQGIMPGL